MSDGWLGATGLQAGIIVKAHNALKKLDHVIQSPLARHPNTPYRPMAERGSV